MKTIALMAIVAAFAVGCHCDEIDCYGGPEPKYTVTTPEQKWQHVHDPINYTGAYLTFTTADNRHVCIKGRDYTVEEEKK